MGILPDQFWKMTPAENLAVLYARAPKPQSSMTKPGEIEEISEEPMQKQSPEQIEQMLKMLTAGMGGKVVVRNG